MAICAGKSAVFIETRGSRSALDGVDRFKPDPPRDAMLSHAAHEVGAGWTFGLHEALGRVGRGFGTAHCRGRSLVARRLPTRFRNPPRASVGLSGLLLLAKRAIFRPR